MQLNYRRKVGKFPFYRAFRLFENDEAYGVAVLSGRGGNFCAGYDLKELANLNTIDTAMGKYGEGPSPMVSYSTPKFTTSPTHTVCIAAIHMDLRDICCTYCLIN